MKSRIPQRGKSYDLEDYIKSDFKECIERYGEERTFDIYDSMLKKKYLNSFKGVSPIKVKQAMHKVIGKPFLIEIENDWKKRANEGINEEEILKDMSSGVYIEDNLGKDIPKEVKAVYDKVLSKYIELRRKIYGW